MSGPYETEKLLNEYLLFHYGTPEEILPYPYGPRDATDFPVRCVSECVDTSRLKSGARALDLGCAVGRSAFELARYCEEVIAVDFSHQFIEAAQKLRADGEVPYRRIEEGDISTPMVARAPEGIERKRVRFEVGDATALRGGLGHFDVVLLANLIDRLPDPSLCLARLWSLLPSGGQLIITSPYTWLTDFTPRDNWVGGRHATTLEGLRAALDRDFVFQRTQDLPFLIREHSRKFQWSVAQASLWIRR